MDGGYDPSLKQYRQEEQILRNRFWAGERPVLIDLIGRLRLAGSADEFSELHRSLFQRFKGRQDTIDKLVREKRAVGARIKELRATGDTTAVREASQTIALIKESIDVERSLQNLLSVVGDGIAWKATSYDRAAITVLGEGDRVARLAAEDGLLPELQTIEDYWQQGVFAMHNDLTTCLRHGDVTVFHDGLRRSVIEVKRSKDAEASPQMARMRDAATLINTRRHTFPDGSTRSIVPVRASYRCRLKQMGRLIQKARQEGYAATRMSPCQLSGVVINGHPKLTMERFEAMHTGAMREHGWHAPDRAFAHTTTVRRMRERRHSFATLAPLSIYPFDLDDVADLMLGNLDFFTVLNVDELARRFAVRGINVEISAKRGAGEWFIKAERRVGDRLISAVVDPSLREQLLLELLRPECAIAAVQAVLEAAEHEPLPERIDRIVSFPNERLVWEAWPKSTTQAAA